MQPTKPTQSNPQSDLQGQSKFSNRENKKAEKRFEQESPAQVEEEDTEMPPNQQRRNTDAGSRKRQESDRH